MCGRYYLSTVLAATFTSNAALWETAGDLMASSAGDLQEICPGDMAPAIFQAEDGIKVINMRWGFENPRGRLIINARSETVREKPTFRDLVDAGRCLLPASGYYEWRRSDRQKFSISPEKPDGFYLAGLYRLRGDGCEFVILTQPPTEKLARIHNRMPVILNDQVEARRWLAGEVDEKSIRYAGDLDIHAEGPEQLSMDL